MSRSDRGRNTPYVRPVQRVELSEKNVKLRMILIVVLLAIASVSIVTALSAGLKTEPGWQQVEAQATKINCSQDFVLNYDFSEEASAASAQFKKLTTLYSSACEDAYRIFTPDATGEGYANVYDLNRQPNETVTVESALYQAFSLIQQYGNRHIYLAPVYAEYARVFRAETDVEAASYDPVQNPELMEYIAQAASFAADPNMIDLQLLGDNRVKLYVSDAYLSFAKDNEIESFVDFNWMTNAFIADFLAQVLTDNGFTKGYLASYDGFTRNLDARGNSYSLDLFDRQGSDIYAPAVLHYTAPASIVFLRDYPLGKNDVWHYYAFSDERIASLLIDPQDGVNKASTDSLVSYAADQSCAQLLMQMIPVLISDEFSKDAVRALASTGIHSIWYNGATVCYTDEQVNLSLLPQEDRTYTKEYAG